jgi:hypothetical protein
MNFKPGDKVKLKKKYWNVLTSPARYGSSVFWLKCLLPAIQPEKTYIIYENGGDGTIKLKEDLVGLYIEEYFFEFINKTVPIFGIVKFCKKYYK